MKNNHDFYHVPAWMGIYHPGKITTNAPQFRYYASKSETAQPVTLYISQQQNEPTPIKMYFSVQQISLQRQREKDTSAIKDVSSFVDRQQFQTQRINVSTNDAIHDSSWVRKYEPSRFIDLLTDELHNRNVLTWLKSWDPIVFRKNTTKPSAPTFFQKGFQKQGTTPYIPPQFSYKKLLLLAGPPGCGKTTLARVIAKHCGYHWQEINASDDRSGKVLINKIDNLVSNKTIRAEQKPVCVIIDQVDGALDSDSNGLKQVLNYLQTGQIQGEFKVNRQKDKPKQTFKSKGFKTKETKIVVEQKQVKTPYIQTQAQILQKRINRINRPVIFICNDPFVRGLKQLRSKAIVVYFTTLQEQRLVKRLKQITQKQKNYVESESLVKICRMCNNDVRSSVGVLQLVLNLKAKLGYSVKDILNKMKLSFVKDVQTSTNQFLNKVSGKKQPQKGIVKYLQNAYSQHSNQNLLNETFFHNILNHKQVFLKFSQMCHLYRQMVNSDVAQRLCFALRGQIQGAAVLPYVFYKYHFCSNEVKKFQFPSAVFERNTKRKNNQALLEKLHSQLPTLLKSFTSKSIFLYDYLHILWMTMQTSSPKQQDVLQCVYKMLTYGFKLANRGSPHLFVPQIDTLLTFGSKKPDISLSNTSRNMIEQNYEFLKMKGQLLADVVQGNQGYEKVIASLKKNRRRKRESQHGQVKYKFLQGTGTQVKYDLKIGYFFENKQIL